MHHEVYVRQPEMFMVSESPVKVLTLHRAIYGLKQSGKKWHDKLDNVFREIGFEQSKHETCLYKTSMKEKLVLLSVYVDDTYTSL